MFYTKIKKILFVFLPLFAFVSVNSEAKIFSNAYASFEMADNWNCNLDDTEWVCRSSDPVEAKEAVIVLTAKQKGPADSIEIYQNHLNNSITNTAKPGQPLTSTVKYKAVPQRINDQIWLDALHIDSELKYYYTRYLATVKDEIAVLVTFSAHNKLYSKYSSLFDKAKQSIRLANTEKLKELNSDSRGVGERFGNDSQQALMQLLADDGGNKSKKKSGSSKEIMLGVGFLAAAVLLYILLKIFRNKK